MNLQQNSEQLAFFRAAMRSFLPGETIYCLQRGDENGPTVSVYDTADARDNAGGQTAAELWFDLDIPADCTPEQKVQLANQGALIRAYTEYTKCRLVFRNAASIASSTVPGFKFAPGDVVLWTNDYGVKWHARRVVDVEMAERGPTYYLTPNDAPWSPVREANLQHAGQTYDELLELAAQDYSLLRRLEQEPAYLRRAAETIAARLAAEGPCVTLAQIV
ncbi:hypothetical protein [Paraburkholderia youngii]|uniref:hypothetical protein n=1 Tax=Paraburkholderia youngii TaxID=2782701 RepID=UPI003D234D43